MGKESLITNTQKQSAFGESQCQFAYAAWRKSLSFRVFGWKKSPKCCRFPFFA